MPEVTQEDLAQETDMDLDAMINSVDQSDDTAEEDVQQVSNEDTQEQETADTEDANEVSEDLGAEEQEQEQEQEEQEEQEEGLEQDTEAGEEESASSEEIDYKAEYTRIMSPFRANKTEMAVQDVDEVRTLMQMGANYSKKMGGLKPNLQAVKMLKNNDLLDESKISFMIDVHKGDPTAISKLLKDLDIDPMSLDGGDLDDKIYTPTDKYNVSSNEMDLDAVLDDIKDSAAYKETIEVVGNLWDDASRQVINDSPQVLSIINSHMESGIYTKIAERVQRDRMFGKLGNMSDIHAYKQVGDAMQAAGELDLDQDNSGNATASNKPVVKEANRNPVNNTQRKKAAGGNRSNNTSTDTSRDFDPLKISDEELDKIVFDKYS